MKRNIDKLVNSERDLESPSERLEQTFLDSRPRSQWPPYIDETAKDIVSGIVIGETNIDQYNFPREVGPLYRDGLIATTDNYSTIPETLATTDDTDLGRAIFLLNRLEHKIKQSDTGLENTQRAVTAVLETVLTDTAGSSVTPQLNETNNSTADVLLQLLSDPAVAEHSDAVFDAFEDAYHRGLLETLDEPQMTTPLWRHQRDALHRWLQADCQGYVDMATATGKTVLGLAAIAVHYGALHPLDTDLGMEAGFDHTDRKSDVLVVAHNDLILEQWRREFDRHLNIPSDRTSGEDVTLSWGRVHFRTAQTLLNQEIIDYDLVILDEAHHYASGTGWGQLLDAFDTRVLALSGSVDTDDAESSTVRDRLETQVGPECKQYTLTDAQQDGVVPTFEWSVVYTDATDGDDEFAEITEKATVEFDRFQSRLRDGTLDIDTDRRLRTFEDIRTYSHTSEGDSLKQTDDQFRDLVTTLFSRRTQRWNHSPDITAVADVVEQYCDQHVVVLTKNNAQVDAIAERLRDRPSVTDTAKIYTVRSSQSSQTQRDTVDEFDDPEQPSILIGTGDLIGEGVDIQHATVGINMATGSVNKQLVQRIGRVLRNPGDDTTAMFVNLVGVPVSRRAQVPTEDGQQLVEDAAQFRSFGESFNNDPQFRIGTRTDGTGVGRLLEGGSERITALDERGTYGWPDDESRRTLLEETLSAIEEQSSPDEVVEAWSDTDGQQLPGSSTDRESLVVTVRDATDRSVENAVVSLVADSDTAYGRTDEDGRVSFDDATGSCLAGVRTPSGDVQSTSIDVDESGRTNHEIVVQSEQDSPSGVEG